MVEHNRVLQLAKCSEQRQELCGTDFVSLTSAQDEVYHYEGPSALWRDGNQLGKSLELAKWVVDIVTGRHPTIRRRSPVRVLVISYSLEQMIPLMEKLWAMAPKHRPGHAWRRGQPPRLTEKCGFEVGRGITGKPPRLVFEDGSEVVFGTYKQGAARIAGGTFDAVVMDEPPPESVYGEVLPRILRKKGLLRIVMTPVPDMPPMGWLWEKADSTEDPLVEFNFGLTEDILIPQGWPLPWLLQEDIDRYAASLLEVERAMRIDGAREPLVTGRWLQAFDEATHVVRLGHATALADFERPTGVPAAEWFRGWYFVGSWDHGTIEGKQVFSIQAYRDRTTDRPKVVLLDEHVNQGITTPEHDVQDALDTLERNGLRYKDINAWVGDVPTGSNRFDVRKSNKELRKELARQLGVRVPQVKPIHPPKKHAGSLSYGMRLMNTLMERQHLWADSRCEGFVQGAKTFAGAKDDPFKDPLDAPRYGIEHACTGRVLTVLSARY